MDDRGRTAVDSAPALEQTSSCETGRAAEQRIIPRTRVRRLNPLFEKPVSGLRCYTAWGKASGARRPGTVQ